MRKGAFGAVVICAAGLVGCEGQPDAVVPPAALAPIGDEEAFVRGRPPVNADPIDLSKAGAVVWGSASAEVIDTRAFPVQVQRRGPFQGEPRRVRNFLPPHGKPTPPEGPDALGGAAPATVGTSDGPVRVIPGQQFVGITQTGWVPPDPTLAVGPNHIVVTVNQDISFFSKAGALQFNAPLNSTGNPGFFETVGAGGFTFDPKCFFDQYAQRFVVVAPETYGTTEAWICIAVSDDADPNGVWYKYRTNAVITAGSQTYWWDYPGFGYDHQAYYVSGNLFGLNQSGWGGVGFRVFNKTPLLTGSAATFATLRDANSASVQAAHHAGSNPARPYFASISGNGVRIHAINNPITAPSLTSVTVTVPAFSGPTTAPAQGGEVSTVDHRIFNAYWRGGRLWATHNVTIGDRVMARWYELNVSTWPGAGSPTLLQSGNIDAGPGKHSFFPALAVNSLGETGFVFGTSDAGSRVDVRATGRRATEPAGRTGVPVVLKPGDAAGAGRWGDYYGMVVDPSDDQLFWGIGMYRASFGWSTWVGSFRVGDQPLIHGFPDSAGGVVGGSSVDIDVLANDYSSENLALTIQSFQFTTVNGGQVTRLTGAGPGGRDMLRYRAPTGFGGVDSFFYNLRDSAGRTAQVTVAATVYDPMLFRDPDPTGSTRGGLDARYYDLNAPQTLPDFATLTPFVTTSVADINVASTNGNFGNSGRADNVGAVYEGYFVAPAADLYTFTTSSDDGSRLFIGATRVVDNDGLHGMQDRSGVIGLKAGPHRVRVEFFESGGGAGLIVSANRPGQSSVPIPAGQLVRPNPCRVDLNGDGIADFNDYLEFLNFYNALNIAADFNGDGVVDFNDYLEFLNVYNAGC